MEVVYVETDEFEQTKKVGISAADWGEQGEQTRHIKGFNHAIKW